uniref:DUF7730 domain-containing protein n=1 Tax=Bionectria ochroleuca TaxID=29856 RepID=A0A0B7KGU7_BIOOC
MLASLAKWLDRTRRWKKTPNTRTQANSLNANPRDQLEGQETTRNLQGAALDGRRSNEFARYIPETAEPVPALPIVRPRLLTPSASREDLSFSATNVTAQCAIFGRLPFEIRRRILVEAFGGHTVHMDLSFDHPELPADEAHFDGSKENFPNHGNRHLDERKNWHMEVPQLRVDTSLPKGWIWRSSECHRRYPWKSRDELKGKQVDRYTNAAEDRCRFGGGLWPRMCQWWSGDGPSKCCIGAMGWLLSCRQAYSEGIDVLYGTNMIHTASKQMMLHLDELILPQRLSIIKSVELVWFFKPYPWSHSKSGPLDDLLTFNKFLAILSRVLPNLRSCYLALQGDILPRVPGEGYVPCMEDVSKSVKITDRDIMRPIDSMVGKLGSQVTDFRVALSSLAYQAYQGRRAEASKLGKAIVEQVHDGHLIERHWRSIDKGTNLKGYWIQLGHRDLIRNPHQIYCFSSPPEIPEEDQVFERPFGLEGHSEHLIT